MKEDNKNGPLLEIMDLLADDENRDTIIKLVITMRADSFDEGRSQGRTLGYDEGRKSMSSDWE